MTSRTAGRAGEDRQDPEPILLVGHSGGDLLLPAITGALVAEVAGVIFVAEISGAQHLALVTDPIAVTDALLNFEDALMEPA